MQEAIESWCSRSLARRRRRAGYPLCNEMSLGRQGRVSAEARVRSGRLRQGAAAAMALAPGQAGPRERGGTRSLRRPRNAPCCATRYSRWDETVPVLRGAALGPRRPARPLCVRVAFPPRGSRVRCGAVTDTKAHLAEPLYRITCKTGTGFVATHVSYILHYYSAKDEMGDLTDAYYNLHYPST